MSRPLEPEITDRASALAWLDGRINYERTRPFPHGSRGVHLDRIRALLVRLGNPHERMPAVHIAGTKGKGSTAAMTAAVLSTAGYRVGMYTSPHLDRLEERLCVDGQPCAIDQFVELARRTAEAVEPMDELAARSGDQGPTYFEIATAMAFLHFETRGAQLAVIEVGLGGRLDSTNVCHPVATAITSISLDHTRQLGDTLGRIAGEKAGIIKPGVPIVSGVVGGDAADVIERRAEEQAAPLRQLGRDFDYRSVSTHEALDDSHAIVNRFDFEDRRGRSARVLSDLSIGLPGEHQVANASVAVAVLEELGRRGFPCDESSMRQGLADARCQARIELIGRNPRVIVDTAHNTASVDALLDVLALPVLDARQRVLIFATSRDKDAAGMLKRLLPRFDEVLLTCFRDNPRGTPVEDLAHIAASIGSSARVRQCDAPDNAWRLAESIVEADDLLCVAGSFFLAAELRPLAVEQARQRAVPAKHWRRPAGETAARAAPGS